MAFDKLMELLKIMDQRITFTFRALMFVCPVNENRKIGNLEHRKIRGTIANTDDGRAVEFFFVFQAGFDLELGTIDFSKVIANNLLVIKQ